MKNDQTGAARLKALLVALGLMVCAFLAGAFFTSSQSGYKAIGNKFVNAVVKEDAPSSYALMSPNLQKRVGNEQKWQAQVKQSFGGQTVQFKLLTSSPVQNPEATYGKTANPQHLVYSFVFSSGKHYRMDMVVIQTSGAWKVDEFTSELQ